jgi:phage baseplate assembly protein W
MPALRQIYDEALGSGLEFPFRINQRGGFAVANDHEKVRQSIWMILSTAKGERVMRPDFGCDIHSFVFAASNAATLTQIKSAVREALLRWEPRIDLKDIELLMDGQRNRLQIEVTYRIRSTNSVANLVYPFYLRPGAE